jgi:hypothetical protein
VSAIIITIRDGRARIYRECEHCGSEVAPRALARCRVCRRMVCPDCMDKGCTICRECAEWGSGHADIPELCRARDGEDVK